MFIGKGGKNYYVSGDISGGKIKWTDSVDFGKACSEYASFAMSGNGSNAVLMYADKHMNYQYHVINIDDDDFALDNGSWCVSHDINGITLSDTLAALYLKPLQRRAKLFGGKIFPDYEKPIRLLVDVKNPFHGSIEILNRCLANYKSIIWAYNIKTGKANDNPVKVVLNGDNITQNDINYLLNTPERFVSIDSRIDHPLLGQEKHPELFPLVSDSWKDKYENNIDQIVTGLHLKGEKVRFWGTDDTSKVWKYLQSHKVDVISTDKLKEIRQYFK